MTSCKIRRDSSRLVAVSRFAHRRNDRLGRNLPRELQCAVGCVFSKQHLVQAGARAGIDAGRLLESKDRCENTVDRALILLSCSRDKRDGGSPWPERARQITDRSCLPSQRTKLLIVRKWICHRLKGESPWLYNGDHRGGFCHERWSNSNLTLGPDFDCQILERAATKSS
jgi:hypothetical protein